MRDKDKKTRSKVPEVQLESPAKDPDTVQWLRRKLITVFVFIYSQMSGHNKRERDQSHATMCTTTKNDAWHS